MTHSEELEIDDAIDMIREAAEREATSTGVSLSPIQEQALDAMAKDTSKTEFAVFRGASTEIGKNTFTLDVLDGYVAFTVSASASFRSPRVPHNLDGYAKIIAYFDGTHEVECRYRGRKVSSLAHLLNLAILT